jgi:hypothetical protein
MAEADTLRMEQRLMELAVSSRSAIQRKGKGEGNKTAP